MFASIFSTTPLRNLVGFILVPAPKQIVFFEAWHFVVDMFLFAVVKVIGPWAVKTEFAQEFMRGMTKSSNESPVQDAERLLDEL